LTSGFSKFVSTSSVA